MVIFPLPLVFCIKKSVPSWVIVVSSPLPKENVMLSFNCIFPPEIKTSPPEFVIPAPVVKAAPVTSKPALAFTLPVNVTCPDPDCVIA